MSKKKNQQEVPEVNISETISKAELFIKKYSKKILGIIIALLLIILLFVAYNSFVVKPQHKKAQDQIATPERYFRADSFSLALKGDGNFYGFEQIIEKFGSKADPAVYLYAGICELQLNNYDNAISYLKRYKSKDPILKARAKACIGDAYVNKGDLKTAITYFNEAAQISDDIFSATYLKKAADCYVELEDYNKALDAYNTIKYKYEQAPEAMDVDKYISRIEVLQNK